MSSENLASVEDASKVTWKRLRLEPEQPRSWLGSLKTKFFKGKMWRCLLTACQKMCRLWKGHRNFFLAVVRKFREMVVVSMFPGRYLKWWTRFHVFLHF